MSKPPYPSDWYDIDTELYEHSVKAFARIKKILGVKLKLHADTQVSQGDIFLFNHFSRFETFIPQFLIFAQTGAYSCAIASSEFFHEDTVLARYLQQVGVFPHNHPRLFALLAAQVLRGRKVIIFPEGGMVKDRRVIDRQGQYSIYSRLTGERRKQHTGAAVLAQGIETCKATIRNAYERNDVAQLAHWQQQLQLPSLEQLLAVARKPTLIIPANITFYPIRCSENLLLDAVELFSKKLTLRQTEELLIEGNILLKNTDMDIRMGTPVDSYTLWSSWNHYLVNIATRSAKFQSLDAVFALHAAPKNWLQRSLGLYLKKAAHATRDAYMKEMYANVTINLSHLASTLILYCMEHGRQRIERQRFFTALYLAVKQLQHHNRINLHRSLLNPHDYYDLSSGVSKRFEQFICIAKDSHLLDEQDGYYHFLPKLLEEQSFDTIRLENSIAVYNNEAKPITAVRSAIMTALRECNHISATQLAAYHFDDECRDLRWEQHAYNKPRYADINQRETANADASPFFLYPECANGIGVLLIHGLLASPAELRDYGDYLLQQGYTVLGVRLKGHGSSPYCLREQTWQDWYASVVRGFSMLKTYCPRIFVTGFSTGSVLALRLAAEQHSEILGVTLAALPLKFHNPAFMLVPLLHGTNKLVDMTSSYHGIKSFIENEPEHSSINYRQTPVKSLYELHLLIADLAHFLPNCQCAIFVLHGEHDPIVEVKSAQDFFSQLQTLPNPQSTIRRLKIVNSQQHGILMENSDGTWAAIDEFMRDCSRT